MVIIILLVSLFFSMLLKPASYQRLLGKMTGGTSDRIGERHWRISGALMIVLLGILLFLVWAGLLCAQC